MTRKLTMILALTLVMLTGTDALTPELCVPDQTGASCESDLDCAMKCGGNGDPDEKEVQ